MPYNMRRKALLRKSKEISNDVNQDNETIDNTETTICVTNDTNIELIIENNDTNDGRLLGQIAVNEIETHFPEDNGLNELNQTVTKTSLEMLFKPVFTHIQDMNNFNELEFRRLSELFRASNVFSHQPFYTKNIIEITDLNELNRITNISMDRDIQDVIKFAKSLHSFNNLCLNDQLALIKYGCLETLILRYTILYDINTEYWTLVWLTAIVLFNPNRPNLQHRDVIKAEQQLYIYLLQRYLNLKYKSDLETQTKLSKLMNPLKDLQIICDIEKRNGHEFYLETYGPILKEILYDITNENWIAEQQLYIYLLQRYLNVKYKSDLETQTKLSKLMNPLKDLQIICDIEKRNGHEFYLETYGPILKEILYDITNG
ncbi:unnamed protein product [Oppiella nova]|uniref:NR LBD domain-containing protein n=1 Tax=Oppiella nova TaxID=334625 RepID=A0A7R9M3L4_9ACAR|nr:unnamed protein product [Oppiella nova]CAG2170085.1 unnamed protein product [Oppiella nova]